MNRSVLEKNERELPKNWIVTHLSDLIQPSKEKFNPLREKEHVFIGLEHIESNTGNIIGRGNSKNIRSTKTRFHTGDILYGRLRPYLNKVCMPNFDGVCSTDILVFPKNLFIESQYLTKFLSTNEFVRFTNQNMKGVQHPRVSFEIISKYFIPLPPLKEQKRIVAKIEELFSKISEVKKILEYAEKQIMLYKKIIIFNGISGHLTKNWRDNNEKYDGNVTLSLIFEERKKFLEKNYKEINPETQTVLTLPKSWAWTSLNNITKKIVDGTHFTPNYIESGIPFLSVKDIRNDQIFFDNCKFISKSDHDELIKRCNPEFNDVLITKSGTIGRTAIIKTKIPFSLFVSVALLKIFDKYLNPYYLNYVLKNYINHINISQKIKGGVIKNFHLEDLRLVPIPIPSTKEQNEIVNNLDFNVTIINNYRDSLKNLKMMLDLLEASILKQAFEGKLVPQDSNDESAEILLQKIKQEKERLQENQKVIQTKTIKTRRIKNAK